MTSAYGGEPYWRTDYYLCISRQRKSGCAARLVRQEGRRLLVEFDEPATAVVPGQFAVFYEGDRVLGGGAITESWAARPVETS